MFILEQIHVAISINCATLDGFGICIWSFTALPFSLLLWDKDLLRLTHDSVNFSCLSGDLISEKLFVFLEWINVIQEYSRVTMYYLYHRLERTRICSKQLPLPGCEKLFEFDDTINQVRIFQEAEMDRILLLPQYSPQLRYFLHRPRFVRYCMFFRFYKIQQVPSDFDYAPSSASGHRMPSETTFSYTPPLVMAL